MSYQMVDYAWWRPSSVADLQGATVVARYLSNDSSKNLTRGEAETLTSWGVSILCNWESTGQGGDFAQGVADAQTAQQQAADAGKPSGRPIVFSIDEDIDPSSTDQYRQGVCSVIPAAEVGVYGSAAMCQHWAANGCPWNWRTMSTDWSGGSSTQNCLIAQINIAPGGNFDYSELLADDVGQWNLDSVPAAKPVTPQAPVAPASEEDDMSQQAINNVAALGWLGGKASVIQLGYDGAAPTIRLVLQLSTGPLVLEDGQVLANGTAVWQIPANLIASCRGAIAEDTAKTGSPFVLFAA